MVMFRCRDAAVDETQMIEYPLPMTIGTGHPMTKDEFARSFRDDHEIGRDITDTTLTVYYDNGEHVARIVENRRTTRRHAERLDPESAAAARDWCARQHRQEPDSLPAAPAGRNRRRLTPEYVASLKAEINAPAQEVLEHIHNSILAMPAFTLRDGTKARVTNLAAPAPNDDGDLVCGFDVQLPGNAHLEFYVKNTGWGRPFVAAVAPKQPRSGHGR
jgi:hypothetical protein